MVLCSSTVVRGVVWRDECQVTPPAVAREAHVAPRCVPMDHMAPRCAINPSVYSSKCEPQLIRVNDGVIYYLTMP